MSRQNEHFLLPDTHTYVYVSEGKKCSFFEKFGVLCFLVTSILKFVLSSYYRRLHASVLFSLENIKNGSSFQIFAEVIKREHWHEIGQQLKL